MKSAIVLMVCLFPLTGQEIPAGQLLHLTVPTATSVRPLSVSALHIERGPEHPSIVRLKGNVEIKTPVCVVIGPGKTHNCGGYVVVRADEANLHEDTGQIEPHGNVSVTREQ